MNRKILAIGVLCAIALVGCKNDSNMAAGGGAGGSKSAVSTDLDGTWKADLGAAMDQKTDKNDPAAEMAKAFANMFGNIKMRIKGDTFKLTLMSIPIEGHYTLSGAHMTLTPEKVAGKTPEEFKEMQKGNPGMAFDATDMKQMDGDVAADKKSFTLHTKDKSGKVTDMTFKREEQKVVQNTLKTDAERAVVGTWSGKVDPGPGATDKQKQEAEMAKSLILELELRQDNTFGLDMFVHLDGTWSADNGKVTLNMMGGSGEGNKPMVLDISPDNKTLTGTDPSGKDTGKMTFTKED